MKILKSSEFEPTVTFCLNWDLVQLLALIGGMVLALLIPIILQILDGHLLINYPPDFAFYFLPFCESLARFVDLRYPQAVAALLILYL